MNSLFRYESNLIDCFKNNYLLSENQLLISEMKIRWGNIDLVEISNNTIPFTPQQCQILSKPSCAKIFMKLKNKRPIAKETLFNGLGLSSSTFGKALSELIKVELIIKNNNLYVRNVSFKFPRVVITGYEAKLTDYNKALYQACINKEYVDYSYMVFPMDVADKLINKHEQTIKSFNLGLIGVNQNCIKKLIKPQKNQPLKPYIRLMNLVMTHEYPR